MNFADNELKPAVVEVEPDHQTMPWETTDLCLKSWNYLFL